MSFLFQPFTQRTVTLPNRIVCSPMCMYSAGTDGKATDWHLVHYGTRAAGKAGLVMLEATAVESRGRISMSDLGLWCDEQMEGLRRIVDFIHSLGVKAGIQIAHAGRKAQTDEPSIAPSAIPFRPQDPVPTEMSAQDIQTVIRAFSRAAARARAAGFDVLEIHAAHGYLIHEFLSPLSNRRTDEYGGTPENRRRFLREIVHAVRREWGEDRPLYVRISATDYHPEGITVQDSIELARNLKAWDVDLVDVSSGGLLPIQPSSIYPGYQVPFSESIRHGAGIATGAVGLITTPEQAEEILGSGRADLVFLARELLRNPYWPVHAARKLGAEQIEPRQYQRAW
jgi:NADPH2 dehydrogenase